MPYRSRCFNRPAPSLHARRYRLTGIALAVVATVAFALRPVLIKIAYGYVRDPITLIALRSIFRKSSQFDISSPTYMALAVLGSALSTGLVAPLVYQLVRRVDQLRRRDDAGAAVI